MLSINKCAVPANTLLESYVENGAYTDCYSTDVSGHVSFAEFIHAFYTTPLFMLERSILTLAVSRPSTDDQARQLADGVRTTFAAWQVENRNEHELLMCDLRGSTRSWFMLVPLSADGVLRTRLFFGSAVVPVQNRQTGQSSLGFTFNALLGFHKIYSALLLYSARSNIGIRKGVQR
jgi:hypothetical protein